MDREALAGLYALTLQEKLEEEEGQDEEGPPVVKNVLEGFK